jgi:dihydroxyacid dehydratase/phosphogluconate dehydratase
VVFDSLNEFLAAVKRGEPKRNLIAVIRPQGPAANKIPELHILNPFLFVLLGRWYKAALKTDRRMSSASGKTPAAIHVTLEAARGGPPGRVRTGNRSRLDAEAGRLEPAGGGGVLRVDAGRGLAGAGGRRAGAVRALPRPGQRNRHGGVRLRA